MQPSLENKRVLRLWRRRGCRSRGQRRAGLAAAGSASRLVPDRGAANSVSVLVWMREAAWRGKYPRTRAIWRRDGGCGNLCTFTTPTPAESRFTAHARADPGRRLGQPICCGFYPLLHTRQERLARLLLHLRPDRGSRLMPGPVPAGDSDSLVLWHEV